MKGMPPTQVGIEVASLSASQKPRLPVSRLLVCIGRCQDRPSRQAVITTAASHLTNCGLDRRVMRETVIVITIGEAYWESGGQASHTPCSRRPAGIRRRQQPGLSRGVPPPLRRARPRWRPGAKRSAACKARPSRPRTVRTARTHAQSPPPPVPPCCKTNSLLSLLLLIILHHSYCSY